MKLPKFEHLFAFALLIVLGAALYIFREDSEMANLIIGAIIAGFSSISAFFFTKHQNSNK